MIVIVVVIAYVLLAFIGLAVLAGSDADDYEGEQEYDGMDKDNRPDMVRK